MDSIHNIQPNLKRFWFKRSYQLSLKNPKKPVFGSTCPLARDKKETHCPLRNMDNHYIHLVVCLSFQELVIFCGPTSRRPCWRWWRGWGRCRPPPPAQAPVTCAPHLPPWPMFRDMKTARWWRHSSVSIRRSFLQSQLCREKNCDNLFENGSF
jgi:hypothetical protein